jgi:hypothetical protein
MNHIKYMVFDIIPITAFCQDRSLKTATFTKEIDGNDCLNFVNSRKHLLSYGISHAPFLTVVKVLSNATWWNTNVVMVKQHELPFGAEKAKEIFDNIHKNYSQRQGYEGLMIRTYAGKYAFERSYNIVKYKPRDDAEATVIGYYAGRTGKTGSLLGLLGALIVKMDNGIELKLSGLTRSERQLNDSEWALDNPGMECPDGIEAIKFPLGTRVNFTYRGLSNNGVPQEAQYNRIDERI